MSHRAKTQAPRVPRARLLGELQDLIGGALAAYLNDRAPDRAKEVIPRLERAFKIVVKLRERYKP